MRDVGEGFSLLEEDPRTIVVRDSCGGTETDLAYPMPSIELDKPHFGVRTLGDMKEFEFVVSHNRGQRPWCGAVNE